MNKLCLFLEIFGHHGLSQDIHHLIIGDMMTHTLRDMDNRYNSEVLTNITKVIGGPTRRCMCLTSYCPYRMTDITDYVIVRCSYKGSRPTKIKDWDVVYHHDCYKRYLDHWILVFF